MSHTYTQDLKLHLTSPSGTTIDLLITKGGNGNDIMTLFSDQADSFAASGFNTLNGPGVSSPFSPGIKPDNPLSVFNGQSRGGWWKLKCIDQAGADIGYVHGWGLNLTSQKTLSLKALIQGFYNSTTDKMKADTAQVNLRIPLPPYPVFDSAKAVLDSNGNVKFYFTKAGNGIGYYIELKHRNSLETWSAAGNAFNADTSNYSFTDGVAKAFGGNMTQIDSTPVKFAIFNGDVNQNGTIDLNDVIMVSNDANVFATGFVVTDITGNNQTDLNDVLLAFNNSNMFVSVMKP